MEPRLGRIYRQRDYRLWGLQELWRNTPPRLTRPNNATSPFRTPSWGLSVIASWQGWVSDSGSLPRHIFTARLGLQVQDCGQREDHEGQLGRHLSRFRPLRNVHVGWGQTLCEQRGP